MRKIEKHLRNVALFGSLSCARQVEHERGTREFWIATRRELDLTGGVGIRTDFKPEQATGAWHLPFLHHARNVDGVLEFLKDISKDLAFIVCESIPASQELFSASGIRLDHDTVLVEWAKCQSHRELRLAPDKRQICVGPQSFCSWNGSDPIRCVSPTIAYHLKIHDVVNMALIDPSGYVECSVTTGGRTLIW